jgi:hypothetical protein
MGAGQSTKYLTDTVRLEHYRKEAAEVHRVTASGFDTCVDKDFMHSKTVRLSKEEQRCIDEYARLYMQFAKSANKHFATQFENHEREMINRMRQEQMAAAAAARK